tara:strand:+ start:1092 stop:1229 length:138 start_codon:yes stop_codon:yes gene_type:complete
VLVSVAKPVTQTQLKLLRLGAFIACLVNLKAMSSSAARQSANDLD